MNTLKEFISGFKRGMNIFGETIAVIVNSVLLLVVYIVGVGLSWLISKLSKKLLLETRIWKQKTTYWTDLKLGTKPIKKYYQQF